ncbi:MAG: VWA domain-containing protein, partial [Caldilineaceae bacterium]|nr:VWA domain-containing protein [Caldilineaceae bacterium]
VGATREPLKQQVAAIDSRGDTNIGGALKGGFDELAAGRHERNKAAVLLTDGDDTANNSDAALLALAQRYTEQGWRIFTVGLGNSVDERLLQEIANVSLGAYYHLTDPNQLIAVYFDINTRAVGGSDLLEETLPLQQGEQKEVALFVPPNQATASFLTSWPGSTVESTLIQPDGTTITPAVAAQRTDLTYTKGPTYELYQVTAPDAGRWRMQLLGADLPPGGELISAKVSTRGGTLPYTPQPAPPDPFEPPTPTPTAMPMPTATPLPTPVTPRLTTRERIQFAPGTTSYAFVTYLRPDLAQGYLLRVMAQQQIRITINANTFVALLDPTDTPLTPIETRIGFWAFQAAQSGDYTVVVAGSGSVSILIEIPPRPATIPPRQTLIVDNRDGSYSLEGDPDCVQRMFQETPASVVVWGTNERNCRGIVDGEHRGDILGDLQYASEIRYALNGNQFVICDYENCVHVYDQASSRIYGIVEQVCDFYVNRTRQIPSCFIRDPIGSQDDWGNQPTIINNDRAACRAA